MEDLISLDMNKKNLSKLDEIIDEQTNLEFEEFHRDIFNQKLKEFSIESETYHNEIEAGEHLLQLDMYKSRIYCNCQADEARCLFDSFKGQAELDLKATEDKIEFHQTKLKNLKDYLLKESQNTSGDNAEEEEEKEIYKYSIENLRTDSLKFKSVEDTIPNTTDITSISKEVQIEESEDGHTGCATIQTSQIPNKLQAMVQSRNVKTPTDVVFKTINPPKLSSMLDLKNAETQTDIVSQSMKQYIILDVSHEEWEYRSSDVLTAMIYKKQSLDQLPTMDVEPTELRESLFSGIQIAIPSKAQSMDNVNIVTTDSISRKIHVPVTVVQMQKVDIIPSETSKILTGFTQMPISKKMETIKQVQKGYATRIPQLCKTKASGRCLDIEKIVVSGSPKEEDTIPTEVETIESKDGHIGCATIEVAQNPNKLQAMVQLGNVNLQNAETQTDVISQAMKQFIILDVPYEEWEYRSSDIVIAMLYKTQCLDQLQENDVKQTEIRESLFTGTEIPIPCETQSMEQMHITTDSISPRVHIPVNVIQMQKVDIIPSEISKILSVCPQMPISKKMETKKQVQKGNASRIPILCKTKASGWSQEIKKVMVLQSPKEEAIIPSSISETSFPEKVKTVESKDGHIGCHEIQKDVVLSTKLESVSSGSKNVTRVSRSTSSNWKSVQKQDTIPIRTREGAPPKTIKTVEHKKDHVRVASSLATKQISLIQPKKLEDPADMVPKNLKLQNPRSMLNLKKGETQTVAVFPITGKEKSMEKVRKVASFRIPKQFNPQSKSQGRSEKIQKDVLYSPKLKNVVSSSKTVSTVSLPTSSKCKSLKKEATATSITRGNTFTKKVDTDFISRNICNARSFAAGPQSPQKAIKTKSTNQLEKGEIQITKDLSPSLSSSSQNVRSVSLSTSSKCKSVEKEATIPRITRGNTFTKKDFIARNICNARSLPGPQSLQKSIKTKSTNHLEKLEVKNTKELSTRLSSSSKSLSISLKCKSAEKDFTIPSITCGSTNDVGLLVTAKSPQTPKESKSTKQRKEEELQKKTVQTEISKDGSSVTKAPIQSKTPSVDKVGAPQTPFQCKTESKAKTDVVKSTKSDSHISSRKNNAVQSEISKDGSPVTKTPMQSETQSVDKVEKVDATQTPLQCKTESKAQKCSLEIQN